MQIYLVESNVLVKRSLQEFLIDLGHTVITFSSVKSLINSTEANKSPADLALVEFKSAPHKTQDAVLSEMHKAYPNLPLVLLLESEFSLTAEKAISCGIFAYLYKPFSFVELEFILLRLSANQPI